jgi:hypothetical protein
LQWSELRHYHYNLFEWHWADFDTWVKVGFLVNENGELDSVSVPIEPAVDNAVFTRKQPQLNETILTALLGDYAFPVDELAIIIIAHAGKVYATQTGGVPEDITCYKLTDALVGFKIRRMRLDFAYADGRITGLALKSPGMTLD